MREMESTAVNVKEKDTVSVVAAADVAVIVSDGAIPIAVSDAIVPPIMVDKEMIVTTNDVDHVVISKLVVTNETIITVNATSNNSGIEEYQFNLAMESARISTNEVDEIKHNLGENVLDEQQKLETATFEKDVVINENSGIYLDSPVKTKSSDGNEDYSKETKDPASPASPAVPVSVDDDTYDPQYILKSGKFHEHDDCMAYSTTSSEGSESINGYDEDSGDDNGMADHRSIKRRHIGIIKQKSVTPVDIVENTNLVVGDGRLSTKKILAIPKVAATIKNSEFSVTADRLAKKLSVVFRKSRDLDALDKWPHDMYDENEQTRKSRDELLAYYGYDIREEIEAPRARNHHKYGETTAHTGAAGGQQSMKVKRGSMARRNVGGPNKNITKFTTDEYTSEFLALDNSKKSEPTASNEPPAVVEVSGQNHKQQPKTFSVQNEDKKTVDSVMETSEARHHTPPSRATSKYHTTSPTKRNNRQDQQSGGPSSLSSTNTKNYFNRSSTKTPISKEKGAHVNLDSPSTSANLNFFKRRPQQNSGDQYHNNKQQLFNNGQGGQGHNQQHQNSSHSVSRGRNFHKQHTSQQFNRGRCFPKRPTPLSSSSSNQHNYDRQYHPIAPNTAGTARTQHGGGHYQNFNNRQYKKKNQQVEPPPPPTPVVRSSRWYSVQIRRELPDPILNFGGISRTPQPQPPASHQQNLLVMQDQQMKPASQELLQQQLPASLQTQQYHELLQQIHHGLALDHNTGMMVITAADPSSAENQNAAVFQPVTTGAIGVTSLPSETQSLQQPETFMTTTYQQQQLPQQQPPPRSVNLAMPKVAPPPEPHQQLGV